MKKIILFAAMAFFTISASAQVKIGYVNFTELVQLMPEADSARSQMSASAKEADDMYQSMVDEFNSKYQEYDQKKASWTSAIRENKEKELNEISGRIQEFLQSIQQELNQQQNTLFAPIYQKAQDAVRNLAKAKGVTVLLDLSSAIYFDPDNTVDLTQEARKALSIKDGRTLESLQQELAARQQAQQQ